MPRVIQLVSGGILSCTVAVLQSGPGDQDVGARSLGGGPWAAPGLRLLEGVCVGGRGVRQGETGAAQLPPGLTGAPSHRGRVHRSVGEDTAGT